MIKIEKTLSSDKVKLIHLRKKKTIFLKQERNGFL